MSVDWGFVITVKRSQQGTVSLPRRSPLSSSEDQMNKSSRSRSGARNRTSRCRRERRQWRVSEKRVVSMRCCLNVSPQSVVPRCYRLSSRPGTPDSNSPNPCRIGIRPLAPLLLPGDSTNVNHLHSPCAHPLMFVPLYRYSKVFRDNFSSY